MGHDDAKHHEREERSGQSAEAQDVVSVVDDILRQGMASGASDIHFEPTGDGLVVKFRLDGALNAVETLPNALSENIVARLKVLGGLLTYRNDIPQEGRIEMPRANGRSTTEQRLAVFPTVHGQRAVVRLFYQDSSLTRLCELGLPDPILAALERIASSNHGVLLLTGPAGSGKSTTLAAMLRYVLERFPGKSIVALEDPVERYIEGVTQVQISPHGGAMTFATALRSLLRQDPEVLMIGEIRDAETARIAIEAGLTGHLLMSTLHSGKPAGALLRLLEMGIEPYQVTSSVSGVLNQRLVRKLCPACKRPRGQGGRFEAVGCRECLGTGFRGRALIAEMVRLDGALRKAILAKADLDELQDILASRGHMSLRHSGMELVGAGMTVAAELERVCGPAEEDNR